MKVSISKQIALLQKSLAKLFNYQVFTLELNSDKSVLLIIEPSGGLWKGGRYPFLITFPEYFPDDPPYVRNLDEEILHPNIAKDGPVCLNITGYDWHSSFGISDIIQGLLYLFYEPAFDEPLNGAFLDYFEENTFDEYVRNKINASIERQRNKRLAMIDKENEYVMKLSKSIIVNVINSQHKHSENTEGRLNKRNLIKSYSMNYQNNETYLIGIDYII